MAIRLSNHDELLARRAADYTLIGGPGLYRRRDTVRGAPAKAPSLRARGERRPTKVRPQAAR